MEYYHTIHAHLCGDSFIIKAIRTDETVNLPKMVINKQRQVVAPSLPARVVNPEDILGLVNIKTCRLLKMAGKIWDQLSSDDIVWLISAKEWKDYSEKVLIHECKVRHGKKLMIRNPAAMSPKQLFDMVDSHFPDIEKKFTEITPQALTPPPKSKAVSSSSKEKKPFLKAYAGSPHKPPKLTYSEKRKAAAAAAGGVVEEPLEPFSLFKRSRSNSPSKRRTPVASPEGHSAEHHLATSNRDQTNMPPLSPTLLRRVGLGRNIEPVRDIPSFQPQVYEYAVPDGAELDELADQQEGEGSEALEGEEAESAAQEHKSTHSYLSSDSESPRSDRRIYNGHPLGVSMEDSSVMLGTDDATLTTITNSVAHSGIVSSLQDSSISPTHTPYVYGTRFAGTAPVVELDLQDMLQQQDEPAADEEGVLYQDFLYEMDSVDDTVESVVSASEHSAAPAPPNPVLVSLEAVSPTTPPPTVHSFTFAPTSETVNVAESLPDSPDFLAMLAGQVEQQQMHCSHGAGHGHGEDDSVCSDDHNIHNGDDGSSVSELSANTGNMTSMTANKTTESPRGSARLDHVDFIADTTAFVVTHSPVVDFSLESSCIGNAYGDAAEDQSAAVSGVSLEISADLPDVAPRVAFDVNNDTHSEPDARADCLLGAEETVAEAPVDEGATLLGEVEAHYVEQLNQVLDDISAKHMEDLPPSPQRNAASATLISASTTADGAADIDADDDAPTPLVPHAHFQDEDTSDIDLQSHLSDGAEAEAMVHVIEEQAQHHLLGDEVEVAATALLIETIQHEIDETFSPGKEQPADREGVCAEETAGAHSVAECEDNRDLSLLSEGAAHITAPHPVEQANALGDEALESISELQAAGEAATIEEPEEITEKNSSESSPAPAHPVVDHAHAVLPQTLCPSDEEHVHVQGHEQGREQAEEQGHEQQRAPVAVPFEEPEDHIAALATESEIETEVAGLTAEHTASYVHQSDALGDAHEDSGSERFATPDATDLLLEVEEPAVVEEAADRAEGVAEHQQLPAKVHEDSASTMPAGESLEQAVNDETALLEATEPSAAVIAADHSSVHLESEDVPNEDSQPVEAVQEVLAPSDDRSIEEASPDFTPSESTQDQQLSGAALGEVEGQNAEDAGEEATVEVAAQDNSVGEMEASQSVEAEKAAADSEEAPSSTPGPHEDVEATPHNEEAMLIEDTPVEHHEEAAVEASPQAHAEVENVESETSQGPLAVEDLSLSNTPAVQDDASGSEAASPLQMEEVGDALNTSLESSQAVDALLFSDDDLCFSMDQVQEGQQEAGCINESAPSCGSLSGSLEMERSGDLLESEAEAEAGVDAEAECATIEQAVGVSSVQQADGDGANADTPVEIPAAADEPHEAHEEAPESEHEVEVGPTVEESTAALEVSSESRPVTPTRPEIAITSSTPQYPSLVLESLVITPSRRFTDYEDEQPSPLMPCTSQLITLSPDRELENSSLFIRNLPDSGHASDGSESEVPNESELVEGEAPQDQQDQPDRGDSFPDLSSLVSEEALDLVCDESVADSTEEPSPAPPRPHSPPQSPSRTQAQMSKPQPQPAAAVVDMMDHAAAAAEEKAVELRNTVQRQAQELAEANRAKAALEARLDETRQLLQLLVAGRAAVPVTSASLDTREKATSEPLPSEIDLDALENTLKYVTVEAVPAELSDGVAALQALGKSAVNSSKMRKSLRRLLDKKREEKMRAGGHDAFKYGSNSGDDGGGEDGDTPTSLPHARSSRNRGTSKTGEDAESSDSGFSAGSSSRKALNSGKMSPRTSRKTSAAKGNSSHSTSSSSFDSPHRAGVPLPALSIKKDTAGLHSRSDHSAGIADRRASVDDLEMEVTRVHTRSEDFLSRDPTRDTSPPMVSLELGHMFSSQSSDPSHAEGLGTAGTHAWGSMNAEEMEQFLPPSSPPPPPPPSQNWPVATSAIVRSIQQVLPEPGSITSQPPSSESTTRKAALQDLQISLESLPLNQHILSPRHLTVEVSSSSSSAGSDVEAEHNADATTVPAIAGSLLSSQHSSVATFSPQNSTSSLTGRSSTFSPKQIDHKSPVPDGNKVDLLFTAESYESHSDGDSSVDSQNALLLESTPKIRGAGRRQGAAALPHPVPLPLGSVGSAGHQEDGEADALHSRFFQDDSVLPPEAVSHASIAHSDLLHKTDTPFLYNYDTYHALRPDLFLDSGPNSPFNPHSPFMHPADAALRLSAEHVGEGVAYAGKLGSASNADVDTIAAATKANTAANMHLSTRIALSKSSPGAYGASSHPPSAEKVSFRLPNVIPEEEQEQEDDLDQQQVSDNDIDNEEEKEQAEDLVHDAFEDAGGIGAAVPTPPQSPAPEQGNEQALSVDVAEQAAEATAEKQAQEAPVDVASVVAPVEPIVELPTSTPTPSPSVTDKLTSLFGYYLPLLTTARYMENGTLRGLAGRQELQRTTGTRDLLCWCVFQAYGTSEGAVVKGIKMIQVVRALKDADICASISTSQLDLLLTKIHCAKAVSPVSPGVAASSLVNQSLLNSSRVLRKTSAAGSSAASTSQGGNSSKGEQNSNSLAGASFPTFCALMSAIAGIIFAADVKVRQRALKKGVTLGDLSAWNNSPLEEREAACCAMDKAWRRLLERKDHLEVHRMLLESQMSVTGLLLRTSYRRYGPGVPATGTPTSVAAGSTVSPGLVKTFSEADLEAVRLVWDRNSDQIRQIYGFYAASKEARRQGSGPSKLQISFEHCREALVDFQVLPHVVDAQGFARLFKICKLWELQVAEQLLGAQESGGVSAGSGSTGAFFSEADGVDELNTSLGHRKDSAAQGLSIRTTDGTLKHAQSSATLSPGTPSEAMSVVRLSDDPHDFKGSVGNLCLSSCGFMELLTRVALGQQKLGVRPHEALENLMHIMDASDGKAKLIKASRKSTSVRHFVYAVK